MEIKLRALISIFAYIKFKILYGSRFRAALPQSWGRGFGLHISGRGTSVRIGHKLVTRENVVLRAQDGASLTVGDKCFFNINTGITCVDSISIGRGCQFGPNVVIVDHDHDYRNTTQGSLVSAPVIIGDDVWVGAGVVILRGSNIGDGAVIGAGCVVKGEIPPHTVVYQRADMCVNKI